MNWSDLSLKKYNEIKEVLLDKELSNEDKILLEVQIIFDVNPLKIKLQEFHNYVQQLSFMENKIPNMKLLNKYKLGDTIYTLDKRLEKFVLAQWLDFQHFIKEGTDSENYHKLLSVFLIPEGFSEYNEGYDINKVRSDIDNYLSIADSLSIATFFLHRSKALLILSLLSTRKKIMKTLNNRKEKKKVRKEFKKSILQIIGG